MRKNFNIYFLSLVTAALISLLPVSLSAADNVTPLPLNTNVTGTIKESSGEMWFSFSAAADGYYKFTQTGENADYHNQYVALFDKTGGKELYVSNNSHVINELHNQIINDVLVYLHTGTYNIRVKEIGSNYNGSVSIKVENFQTKYGKDTEPNESAQNAISLIPGGKAVGYLYGNHEDASADEEDWYIFNAPSAGTYTFRISSESFAEFKEDNWVGAERELVVFDSKGGNIIKSQASEYNNLEKVHKLEMSIDLSTAGIYYIRLAGKGLPGSYLLTEGDGMAVQQIVSENTDIRGEAVATGVKLALPKLTKGIGWRVYRSQTQGTAGEVIAGFVTGTSFIDVNVDAGKTYYYTIKEVFSGDILGIASNELEITTKDEIVGGNASDVSGEKKFILMKIDSPYMSVNGEQKEIDPGRGTAPIIVNGRTMVPIRAIVESMSGTVDWNSNTQTVTLVRDDRTVKMTLGSKIMIINGEEKIMDVPAQTINSRTTLPIRFVSEALDCSIDWIGSSQEVIIVY